MEPSRVVVSVRQHTHTHTHTHTHIITLNIVGHYNSSHCYSLFSSPCQPLLPLLCCLNLSFSCNSSSTSFVLFFSLCQPLHLSLLFFATFTVVVQFCASGRQVFSLLVHKLTGMTHYKVFSRRQELLQAQAMASGLFFPSLWPDLKARVPSCSLVSRLGWY